MITSEQVQAARALLRWEQNDLAATLKVSLPSIKRLENRMPYESAGVEFIAENGGGPGVPLKKTKRRTR
jgi:transcriptional regulator with XRE-family HTH domain